MDIDAWLPSIPVHLRPAEPITALVTAGAGSGLITSMPGILWGWSFDVTSAATDGPMLYDGTDATGQPIVSMALGATIKMGPGAAFPACGVLFRSGLYQVNSGALDGGVWYATLFRE